VLRLPCTAQSPIFFWRITRVLQKSPHHVPSTPLTQKLGLHARCTKRLDIMILTIVYIAQLSFEVVGGRQFSVSDANLLAANLYIYTIIIRSKTLDGIHLLN
jgi:hypothetical protein